MAKKLSEKDFLFCEIMIGSFTAYNPANIIRYNWLSTQWVSFIIHDLGSGNRLSVQNNSK